MKIIKDENLSNQYKQTIQKARKWGKKAFWLIPLLLLALLLFTSFYTVKENEQGVLITFGRYTKTVDAGLGFKLPWPIQSVHILPVKRTQKIELGYRQTGAGVFESVPDESFMITGDMNVVNVDFFVEWKISDPVKYLWVAEQPDEVLKNMLQSSVRSVVGTNTIDDTLTTGKVKIQADVKALLNDKLARDDIGIQIIDVKVNDSEPPTETVAKAFRDVETAKQEKQTAINLAQEYRNSRIPQAKSASDQIIRSAEASMQSKINEAEGEKNRFEAIYNEFKNFPAISRARMYLETIERILPGVTLFIDDGSGVDKLLPVGSWDNASSLPAAQRGVN